VNGILVRRLGFVVQVWCVILANGWVALGFDLAALMESEAPMLEPVVLVPMLDYVASVLVLMAQEFV
jgi:hypothetical protein